MNVQCEHFANFNMFGQNIEIEYETIIKFKFNNQKKRPKMGEREI